MGWFRRSRHSVANGSPANEAEPEHAPSSEGSLLPVPVASAPALARTERALQMLATQSAQLHASVVELEHRVDAMAQTLQEQALDLQAGRPSYDDVLETRTHTAKVAAELARLEVNLAARIDMLRATPGEIDLRNLTPADTGY